MGSGSTFEVGFGAELYKNFEKIVLSKAFCDALGSGLVSCQIRVSGENMSKNFEKLTRSSRLL